MRSLTAPDRAAPLIPEPRWLRPAREGSVATCERHTPAPCGYSGGAAAACEANNPTERPVAARSGSVPRTMWIFMRNLLQCEPAFGADQGSDADRRRRVGWTSVRLDRTGAYRRH